MCKCACVASVGVVCSVSCCLRNVQCLRKLESVDGFKGLSYVVKAELRVNKELGDKLVSYNLVGICVFNQTNTSIAF